MITGNKNYFIDFDNIKYDYQIYDLVSLLLKYTAVPVILKEKKILQKYYFKTEGKKFDKLYNLINIIACYKGMEMILSTEYYCFIVNKFSEIVLNNCFMLTLDELNENIKIRMGEVKK